MFATFLTHLANSTTAAIDNPFPQVTTGASTVTIVLNIVFAIAGALSVLFMVIGGFRFITSSGDPQGAAQARNTIIYAAVGLAIVIAATTIVNFVLGQI